MKISYAITAFNELDELKNLIPFLLKHKRKEDEIVVLWDNKGPLEVLHYLQSLEPEVIICANEFNHNFADWKNRLTSICNGDYIFQIDADELPTSTLIEVLPTILEQKVDIILIPRNNTVKGLTEEHIKRWGWNIDKQQRINWPDYQWRIYRKCPEIRWKNKVHEVLEGYKTYAALPYDLSFGDLYLHHHKDIERQEKQNNYYNTL
jgi:glycosyltransferase involved in cell wall biosynthesis